MHFPLSILESFCESTLSCCEIRVVDETCWGIVGVSFWGHISSSTQLECLGLMINLSHRTVVMSPHVSAASCAKYMAPSWQMIAGQLLDAKGKYTLTRQQQQQQQQQQEQQQQQQQQQCRLQVLSKNHEANIISLAHSSLFAPYRTVEIDVYWLQREIGSPTMDRFPSKYRSKEMDAMDALWSFINQLYYMVQWWRLLLYLFVLTPFLRRTFSRSRLQPPPAIAFAIAITKPSHSQNIG